MSSLDIKTFISNIEPFSTLGAYELEKLVSKVDIEYLKEGGFVAKSGELCEFFYIVAKGVVKEEGDAEFYYGVRDFFDFESLLSGSFNSSFAAAQELLLYRVAKDDFLAIVHQNQKLENYFFLSAAKKLEEKHKASNSLLVQKISDITYSKPIFIDENRTIFEAVELMTKEAKSFVVVSFEGGESGILTDSDLRKKVLLRRVSVDSPVGGVASKNIKSIEVNDFLFNALILMTKHNIKRVVLTNGTEICGVLTDVDVLGALSTHTQFVARKIELANSKEDLKIAISEIDLAVKNLLSEGVKVKHIIKLVSELNLKVYKRVFESCFDEELRDGCALVVFGSEGRGEQILRTDQDNGVIFRDGLDEDRVKRAATLFNDTLIEIGYPPCEGGVMAKNSEWRLSIGEIKKLIYELVHSPSEESFLKLPILMDIRFVSGCEELFFESLEYLAKKLSQNPQILSRMAAGSLSFDTPLSMLGGFLLDKKEHSGELDIKKGAIFPLVNGLRALAFEKNISVQNSFERIKELNNSGVFDRTTAEELIEAYNFLLEVRLRERLFKINTGHTPDNYISPERLSKMERDLLRDVLKIVDRFKKMLHTHFKLGYLS